MFPTRSAINKKKTNVNFSFDFVSHSYLANIFFCLFSRTISRSKGTMAEREIKRRKRGDAPYYNGGDFYFNKNNNLH